MERSPALTARRVTSEAQDVLPAVRTQPDGDVYRFVPYYPFVPDLQQAISSGQFAFIDRGDYPFATCHVDNVIEGIQRALERGRGGQAYFICDQEVDTFREFIGLIANSQGVSIDGVRSMPYWLAFTIGWFMEVFAALTLKKGDPPLSRSLVRMLGREFTVDDIAARRELGYIGETSREAGHQMYLDAKAAAMKKGIGAQLTPLTPPASPSQ